MAINSVTGGDKFQRALEDIAKRMGKAPVLKVGFFETEQYPDGEYVAQVAAENEFGSTTNPPRPFMRQTFARNKGVWPGMATKGMKATNFDVDKTLGLLGQEITGEVRIAIAEWGNPYPHNSQATIDRKGFDDPLVDTGRMLQSVTWVLEDTK